jgi:hypothetical protein
VAGCVTIVSRTGSPDLLISLDPFRVRFDDRAVVLTAGFGYRWNSGSVDLFANSCDFASYQPTRSFTRAVIAASGIPLRVARGTDAVSWRIHGSDGPPKVVVRGPGGTTITSPASGGARESKGHWMLVENPTDGTTSVLLIRPRAGTWTVSGVPGAASKPTKVDRAASEAHPTVAGKVHGSGASRSLDLAYAVPKGTSLSLVERAKGIGRTIARSVPGQRCPNAPAERPGSDQLILCAHLKFRPSRGPGGKRSIQAVVTRRGIPLLQKDIATFRVASQKLPSRVGTLHAHRAYGFLVVSFPRSRGAARYEASAKLSDGRSLGFDLAPKCNELRIPDVPDAVGARVTIAGMRYDLAMGAARSISIAGGVRSAGPKSKVPRNRWPARSRWPKRVPCS